MPNLSILALAAALTAAACVDLGPGYNPPAPDARPKLEARGDLGDPCEQFLWKGECAPGLECLPAPLGLDRFCSRECESNAQCGEGGACYEGVCVERCVERADWPWPCPWGEERVVDGECLCIPGVSR